RAVDVGRGDRRGAGAAGPEGGHVVAASVGLHAAGAEGAAAGVDDGRVGLPDVLDVDVEPLPGLGQEVGQEHVGPAGQLVRDLLAFRLGDVEADRALAPVGVLEVGVRFARDLVRADLAQAALGVAGDGVLDLDHVGPPVRKDGARR